MDYGTIFMKIMACGWMIVLDLVLMSLLVCLITKKKNLESHIIAIGYFLALLFGTPYWNYLCFSNFKLDFYFVFILFLDALWIMFIVAVIWIIKESIKEIRKKKEESVNVTDTKKEVNAIYGKDAQKDSNEHEN